MCALPGPKINGGFQRKKSFDRMPRKAMKEGHEGRPTKVLKTLKFVNKNMSSTNKSEVMNLIFPCTVRVKNFARNLKWDSLLLYVLLHNSALRFENYVIVQTNICKSGCMIWQKKNFYTLFKTIWRNVCGKGELSDLYLFYRFL